MRKVLARKFFDRDTAAVAKALLGKFLVRRHSRKTTAHMITEVEAYDGFKDKASHASRGKTPRNAPMFGEPGHWYVYFTYGMHWMLNIVTREEGYPAAVLIRDVAKIKEHGEPRRRRTVSISVIEYISGPARLTKRLHIDKKLNGLPVGKKTGLWIENRGFRLVGSKIYPPKFYGVKFWMVKKSPRIGVSYAGQLWSRKKRRFFITP